MVAPYLLMVVFFLSLAFLALLESALTSVGWLPWFNGLPWLRAHFITIGVLLEVTFGLLPWLATRQGEERPPMRWDIWLALNAGLVVLLIGIPLVNTVLLITGGSLIFLAAVLLAVQLARGGRLNLERLKARTGRHFYLAALLYLLLGIFLGTGLWIGWGQALGIANTKEVHVHANMWGFTSLLFAGLLVDLYPRISGRPLAWPKSSTAIFWLMALGALGLVVGPWVAFNPLTVGGVLVHTAGTLLLLANVVRPIWSRPDLRTAGMAHLIGAYLWLLLPVVVAPFIVARVDSPAVRNVEQSGAAILVYGWILPFSYAIVPYLFSRTLEGEERARLGGTRLSLVAIHAGGITFALGLFLGFHAQLFQAAAYALWAVAMLPILQHLWRLLARYAQHHAAAHGPA
jgi:cytochrome c oxidase cbb3-type subunit I